MRQHTATAFGVAFAICIAATIASAGTTPAITLKKARSYAAARGELQRMGWKPVVSDERFDDGTPVKSFGDTRDMAEAGFIEVVHCSGTGLNFCEFRWRDSNACLSVLTYGEYVPERGSPHVDSYRVETCKAPSAERQR